MDSYTHNSRSTIKNYLKLWTVFNISITVLFIHFLLPFYLFLYSPLPRQESRQETRTLLTRSEKILACVNHLKSHANRARIKPFKFIFMDPPALLFARCYITGAQARRGGGRNITHNFRIIKYYITALRQAKDYIITFIFPRTAQTPNWRNPQRLSRPKSGTVTCFPPPCPCRAWGDRPGAMGPRCYVIFSPFQGNVDSHIYQYCKPSIFGIHFKWSLLLMCTCSIQFVSNYCTFCYLQIVYFPLSSFKRRVGGLRRNPPTAILSWPLRDPIGTPSGGVERDSCREDATRPPGSVCLKMVRFYADCRIKPHAPQ